MEIQLRVESHSFGELARIIEAVSDITELDWHYISTNLTGNPSTNIFKNFFTRFYEKIDFKALSSNKKVKWNYDFIKIYSNLLDFKILSINDSIPFTWQLISEHRELWSWKDESTFSHKYADYRLGGLSYNPRFPIEENVISVFTSKIDFRALGMNTSFIIFDPSSIPDDYWPCNLKQLRMNIVVLMKFWDKWAFKGSVFIDNNIGTHGVKKDSIYDNKKIDWKFVNEIKPYYKSYIINWEKPDIINKDDDNDLPF
jgi:hypothetical protein